MKLYKLLAVLTALVLCLLLCSCGSNEAPDAPDAEPSTSGSASTTTTVPSNLDTPSAEDTDEEEPVGSTPLLYKASDESGKIVWLFGSIHVATDDMYPLPDYVLNAYEGSDALAVECDVLAFEEDLQAQTEVLPLLMYTDGTTIRDHIDAELYDSAVEILTEIDSYNAFVDYYVPMMWASLIENYQVASYGYDSEMGIDMYFLKDAKDNGKEIREVESVEAQYAMMGAFSDPLQELLLASAVLSYDDPAAEESLTDLVQTWRSGNEDNLEEILKDDLSTLTAEELVLYEEYTTAMMTDRNIHMTDYAETALQSGDEVFICVGAAHVVGEGGIADLLTKRGYTVEKVSE